MNHGIELPPTVELANTSTVRLQIVRSREQLRAVGRFRYVELVTKLNKTAQHADHRSRELIEPLDSESCVLIAYSGLDSVIGTVRITLHPDYSSHLAWYAKALSPSHHPNSAYVSRLVVKDDYRGSALARRLFMAAYSIGIERSITQCHIYCAPHLERYYVRWGFIRLNGTIVHPDDGEQIPMTLPTLDFAHLERTRSPFLKLAANIPSLET